jgi:hypothetical protein
MSVFALAPILELIMPGVAKILDKVIPDSNARAEALEGIQKTLIDNKAAMEKAIFDNAAAQVEVNRQEASNSSKFVAGWRPATGWLCVAGLTYQFLVWPFTSWGSALLAVPAPPQLEIGTLVTLLTGMLGLGALRTYEKYQGVATKGMLK